MRRLLAAVAVAAALCTTAPAFADNSKDANWTVDCSYTYAGQVYHQGFYDLTKGDRSLSLEGRLQYYSLRAVAGEYFHEYPNWLDYPTSVTPADLQGWHCDWYRGYHEIP